MIVLLLSQEGRFIVMSITSIGLIVLGIAILLWLIILIVFVTIKIRNSVQRKKYSVKQDGDVSTEYETRGLH